MRRAYIVLSLACFLGTGLRVGANGQEKTAANRAARIQELIKQLGNAKFAERDRAARELEAIGAPALGALRGVVKAAEAGQGTDLETSRRASEILRRLEEKIATEKILAPRRVRLKIKDVSVLDAVKELEKQSGYPILINGDRNLLANRKLTLDTGDTTFWAAFDQLCQKGGLVDGSAYAPIVAPPPVPPIRIRPRPRPARPVIPPHGPAPKPPVLNQVQAVTAQVEIAVPVLPAPVIQVDKAQKVEIKAPVKPARPIQFQPVPPLQIQMLPEQHARIRPAGSPQIQVTPGTPKTLPTCYSGAVRIRVTATQSQGQSEVVLLLEASAEPRLQNFTVSSPRLDKASDDQGQALALGTGPAPPQVDPFPPLPADAAVFLGVNPFAHNRQVLLRLKLGDKKAKAIKELTGSLSAQALTPTEPLITVPDILKAAGKTVKRANGGSMNVIAVHKQDNGDVQVQVRMDNLPGQNNPFAGNINGVIIQQIQIQGANIVIGGTNLGGPSPALLDKQGKTIQVANIPSRRVRINNGQMSQDVTVVFRPAAGQEPDRLVLSGQRTVNFQVPFRFRAVPLP